MRTRRAAWSRTQRAPGTPRTPEMPSMALPSTGSSRWRLRIWPEPRPFWAAPGRSWKLTRSTQTPLMPSLILHPQMMGTWSPMMPSGLLVNCPEEGCSSMTPLMRNRTERQRRSPLLGRSLGRAGCPRRTNGQQMMQFDSPEWERTPGPAKELRRPPPRSPQPAERVDPALPLEKQPWFHGSLNRADAENLLSLCKEGSYLVRLSETSPQDCSLSLRSSQGFLHLKFSRTRENQVVLGQHSGPFPSVPELVLHYSSRPLPVQGAGHLALLYPVVTQTP
uniref:SH2 domain-containing adapter protein D isoform X3 n=1 Tax=Callithrix jacchus TaxID=9483 RepID=UPI0023DD0A18|nr:SH2 domain-containing adapter protein D isoform X3 [Callithrix jacchus]